MDDPFEKTVAALWASLGLPRPVLNGRRAELSIDGRTIVLSESPSGRRIVVSGEVGRLAEDAVERSAQVRQLLRESLGLMLTNGAGLQAVGDQAAVIDAQASCPLGEGRIDRLRKAIEDVLLQIDVHGQTLRQRPSRRPAAAATRQAGAAEETTLIFRP